MHLVANMPTPSRGHGTLEVGLIYSRLIRADFTMICILANSLPGCT